MTDHIDEANGIAYRDTDTSRLLARFDTVNNLWYPWPDDGRIVPGMDAGVVLDAMALYEQTAANQLEALRALALEAEQLFSETVDEDV